MWNHSATLLANGKVLVDGETPRLYDPDSGTWTATGQSGHPHQFNYTTTLLSDGRVLVVGGEFPSVKAQLYDPDTGSWTATADMRERLQSHDGDHITATLLRDDTVLVTGLGKSELYDPARGTWTATREKPKLVSYCGAVRKRQRDALAGWQCAAGRARWRRAVRPDHRDLDADRVQALLRLRHIGHAAPRWHGPHGGRRTTADGAESAAELYVPAGVSLPPAVVALPTRRRPRSHADPDSDPDPDTVPTGGGSRPDGRTVLDRHRRQYKLRTRDVVPGRGRATTASASCAVP